MNCYKCNSNKGLSIKARKRNGEVRAMICRACRRAQYHEAKKLENERIYAEFI